MTAPKLEWSDIDETTDGRFAIYSEHPRGEPRYYWLETADPVCAEIKKTDGVERRRIIRQAEGKAASAADR